MKLIENKKVMILTAVKINLRVSILIMKNAILLESV